MARANAESATLKGEVSKSAEFYRMVMEDHICPYGLKAKDLLEREEFVVNDHWLRTRKETEDFQRKHDVDRTPQVFIDGKRIGGYDHLREYFGKDVHEDEATFQPVVAIFSVALLMALAFSWATLGSVFTVRALEWFIAISMCLLGIQKLQDVESFSTMFLNYDLLARRYVRYGYIYPFAETLAGVLMIGGVLTWLSVPLALFIGTAGAVSVIKAVYIDKRELKCACVGGDSNVPLGFISLTENLMMMAMAVWIWIK